jgi:hypothetical protein
MGSKRKNIQKMKASQQRSRRVQFHQRKNLLPTEIVEESNQPKIETKKLS